MSKFNAIKIFLKRILNYSQSTVSYHLNSSPKAPILLIIGITNKCNLKCSFCFHSVEGAHQVDPSSRYMSFDTFKKILSDARGFIDHIELGLYGEPFLHKDILKFVTYAKEQNFHITIDTNGTAISKQAANELTKVNLNSISFSVDGNSSEEYEQLRIGSKFKNVAASIDYFKTSKMKLHSKLPLLVTRGLKVSNSSNKTNTMKTKLKELGIQHFLFSPLQNWGGLFNKEEHQGNYHCSFPWLVMSVDSDGSIAICCEDYNSKNTLGNISDVSLRSAWNSNSMKYYRQALKRKSEFNSDSPCLQCSYLKQQTLPIGVRLQLQLRSLKEIFLELKN